MINGTRSTWRIADRLVPMQFPMVMGILNSTPDSFHSSSRIDVDSSLRVAERMLEEGASILDIGGASSRPGAMEVEPEVEMGRVLPVIDAILDRFPGTLISVDTYRAVVARNAVQHGAGMVNDIGAGQLDVEMLETILQLHVPYVMMHMKGTPATMQKDPKYTNVAGEVTKFLSERLSAAREVGIPDVVIDPGFGFGKTTPQNFTLLSSLRQLTALGAPIMVGLSRKRMINEVLGSTPARALNGTTVLNTLALLKGASILRVHDVKEAVECLELVRAYSSVPVLSGS